MSKVVTAFLDRLAERFAALMAGLVSSRVEGLHAAAQAEQQSELEDLARQYEADGKPAIAQTLRQRAVRLTSTNLAAEALEVMQQLTANDRPALPLGPVGPNDELRGLPNLESGKAPRKRRSTETNDSAFPTLEGQS
jgi:hypothetical protein